MTAAQDPDALYCVETLNDAERALLEAAGNGGIVDVRTGDPRLDDTAQAMHWEPSRNVRARVLVDLLTGDLPVRAGRLRSVTLCGARINGRVDLEGRKLLCPMFLQDCYFAEPINLDDAEAVSVRLTGCRVPGLSARQLQVARNVELVGLSVEGETQFFGARIDGVFLLDGARLANGNGEALLADMVTVGQGMLCRDGFRTKGEIRLVGAHIGGQLVFDKAEFISGNGPALVADSLTVGQAMICRDGLIAQGEIRLAGAHIGGDLDMGGVTLNGNGGPALSADHLTVGHDMVCGDGFTAQGAISLVGAHVGGRLNMSGAALNGRSEDALNASGITVGQSMVCDEGFTAQGATSLYGAHIGGHLDLSGATLDSGNDQFALIAESLVVGQAIHCRAGFTARGEINLMNAKVETLYDYRTSWPDVLYLNGFAYNRFGTLGSVRSRLQWLQRNPGRFTPEIYNQLADAYRRAGDDGAARRVAVAKQWRRRKPYNPLSWLWWVTVGYGYRTWQAFIWAAVLTVVGALVFSGAYPAHMVKLAAHPPRFQPIIYALDVLLPIGGLGQKSAWQPTGGYLDWYWAFAIAGWVLATAVVAGLTGILKRD